MTTASSVARSAAVVRAVADGATPSSFTARAAASLRAVGILIEVLEVPCSLPSRSLLIRSMTTGPSMQVVYHVPVVQPSDLGVRGRTRRVAGVSRYVAGRWRALPGAGHHRLPAG